MSGVISFNKRKNLTLGCGAFCNFSSERLSNAPLCPGRGGAGVYIDWCITDEKLLVFASLISPSKSFCLRSYIKHSSQCFITISKTSKFVKNTPLRVVLSTLFSVFDMPGIVNRTFENRTQSNSIEPNPWIEFD